MKAEHASATATLLTFCKKNTAYYTVNDPLNWKTYVGAAAAISAAETAALAATATAAVEVTAVAAGKIGSNIQQAKAKKGNSTYDKDGIRVNYEPYGTGKGNVHVHHNGIKEHVFRKTPTESIREPISKGLEKIIGNNKKVFTAIEKAIRFVEELCK